MKNLLLFACLMVACAGVEETEDMGVGGADCQVADSTIPTEAIASGSGGSPEQSTATQPTTPTQAVAVGFGGAAQMGIGGAVAVSGASSGIAGANTNDKTADPCGDEWNGRTRFVSAAGKCLDCPPGWYDCDYTGEACEFHSPLPGYACTLDW